VVPVVCRSKRLDLAKVAGIAMIIVGLAVLNLHEAR
jgi:hypothetical protein